MEKTNLSILFFLFLLTSLCNSQDYEYDENYNYYNENYDYYSQELDDYYGPQNLLAPAPPPPPLPPRTGNYMLIMIRFMENNNYTYLLLQ